MINFNKLIQKRIDKSFNLILIATSSIAFVAAIILFNANLPKGYFILNFSVGVIMMFFALFANKIKTSYKIIAVIVLTAAVAVASFIGGGFTSAFLTLLILSNLLAVLLLNRKSSIIISSFSVVLMFILCYYSTFLDKNSNIVDPLLTWGLQIAAYILFIFVLQLSVYTIKNYLIENIKGLKKEIKFSDKLAYYDQLTGLPNINKFRLDVKRVIKLHKNDGFIIILNLKSLNLINSTLGKGFGNQALIETARILNDLKIENLILARTGGNEFSIWIEKITEETLNKRFINILAELNTQGVLLNKKLEFYVSYAKFNYIEDTFDSSYQRAELTLTYIKTNNILGCVSYKNEFEEGLRRKETLKELIKQALTKKEFMLYYQEKHDLKTGKIVGVEALSRLYNENIGFISPYDFIPIIESMNMAIEFGEFVINKVCKDFKIIQEKYNEDISVSINISPSHIINSNIVLVISSALELYKIPANKIILEITEDIMIEGIERVKPILKKLRKLGLKISLDDFGTGYSSLNYLAQLELDELKIDKSFVDQILTNGNMHILLENIIQLSKQFNLDIIAEGVEVKEQCDELNQLGCYIIQGYYFAKPEPLLGGIYDRKQYRYT